MDPSPSGRIHQRRRLGVAIYAAVFGAKGLFGRDTAELAELDQEVLRVVRAPSIPKAADIIRWWGWWSERQLRDHVRRIRAEGRQVLNG